MISSGFKVVKVEQGNFDYDTAFIQVNKEVVQIPIRKDIYQKETVVGKSISVDYEKIDNQLVFGWLIEEVKYE